MPEASTRGMWISKPENLVPIGTAVLCAAVFILWVSEAQVRDITPRLPGQDGRPAAPANSQVSQDVKPGEPIFGPGKPGKVAGSWPGFRGALRTGVVQSDVPLARRWRAGGPPVVWEVTLGPGHAGPAVHEGRVFVLDYDPHTLADTLRCLSLDDGREIWRNSYPVEVPENHGSSRSVPAISGSYVITLGPKCHLVCWDIHSGQHLWMIDLVQHYGTQVPPWYSAQCPLIDEGAVIVAPVGNAVMVALDLATGSPRWRSPPVPDLQMSHASITPVEIAGRKLYVYPAHGGIVVVEAATGKLLCVSRDFVGKMATCPSAVALEEGYIFFSGGYGAGSLLAQLVLEGEEVSLRPVRRIPAREYGSEHHTPIYFGGYLFGSRCPPGAPQLLCMTPEGKILWTSGPHRFIRGPYLLAEDLLYAVDESGTLYLLEATPEEFRILDKHTIWPDAHDMWGPMALVGGRLLVRDLTRLACLDVSQEANLTGE